MSRIGRKPINIPAGVTVTLASDNQITVKGPKGELKKTFHPDMIIKVENDVINVERPSDDKKHRSLHGLTRTLIYNMIEGVTQGYSKALEVQGIGYKVQKQGNKAVFNIGFSHPVEVEEIDGIKIDVTGPTTLVVSGIDKQPSASSRRKSAGKKPPEPYHGKGIRYAGEYVRMKEGKAGKK